MKKCPYCAEEIKDEARRCKHCHYDIPEKNSVINEDKRKLKQKIGRIILGVSSLIFLISGIFFSAIALYRFLFCIALSFFGLGIRTCIDDELFKGHFDKVNTKEVYRSYSYYLGMLTIICCILYLGFYQTIYSLTPWHFAVLSSLLFIFMGLHVLTIIQKFGL